MLKFKKKHNFTILITLIFFLLTITACAATTQGVDETGNETVTAFLGDLSARATASGTVHAPVTAIISANSPARVTQVHVRTGDAVEEGDILMRLDTADLELSLAAAQQNLHLKEANLQSLLAEPEAADLAAANAAVASAQAALDDLFDGPSDTEIAASEANLRAANASLWAASSDVASAQSSVKESQIKAAEAAIAAAELQLKSAREKNEKETNAATHAVRQQAEQALAAAQAQLDTLRAGPNSATLGSAQGSLAAANARRDGSQANLNLLVNGATDAQIANAQSQAAQAEANLAALRDGATTEQLSIAEAELEQARLSVVEAEEALAKATIVAPFAGVVTAVAVHEGEIASGAVAELIDNNNLEVILEVDEIDIGQLQVGQPATITLETWPNDEIDSQVLAIAPSAKTVAGSDLVTYEAHLLLGETALPVRVGMTANANLITSEKQDVLLVPNQAINADRNAGTYSVYLQVGDTVEEVPVTIGLRDAQNTEIVAGLQPGDVLQIGAATSRQSFGPGSDDGGPRGSRNDGGPFGG